MRLAMLTLALSCVALPARAELTWVRAQGAEGCDGTTELVGRLLIHGVAQARLLASHVEGAVEPHESGFRAHVRTRSPSGALGPVQHVESAGPDCRALTPGVVLAIATLLDSATPRAPVSTPSAPHPSFELAVALGSAHGVVPSVGISPGVSFHFMSLRRVGGLLGFGAALDLSGTYYDDSRRSLWLNALYAPAAVCVDALRVRWFSLVPCAGVLIGGYKAHVDDGAPRRFLAVATLGARFVARVSERIRVFVALNGGGLLKGPVYRHDDGEGGFVDVFRPARLQFYPSLGLAHAY